MRFTALFFLPNRPTGSHQSFIALCSCLARVELRGPAVGKAFASVGLFTGNTGAGEGIKGVLIVFRTLILVPILFQTALNFRDDSPYNVHCMLSLPPRSRPAQGPASSRKSCSDPVKAKSLPDTPLPSLSAGPQSLFHCHGLGPKV